MKIVSEKTTSTGTRVIIDLQAGEKIIVVDPDAMYRLGEPHDEIVQGHVITNATHATWCSLEQKWIV